MSVQEAGMACYGMAFSQGFLGEKLLAMYKMRESHGLPFLSPFTAADRGCLAVSAGRSSG
ncbi:hypothetical protein ColTof3_07654 [Colletotrichum tofieldiae]|nr:hypothetical protein ColTof3_07654 [Colletotrichum tofieldiae]